MSSIFISYRREDSIDVTGRIYDRLRAEFGADAIFMDIDTIPAGADFRKHISDAVTRCDVLLAIIGGQWLDASVPSEAGALRRLDDPTDFVRIEIESALQRDVHVIPVLVGDASVPPVDRLPDSLKDLAFRNASEVRSGRDFHTHVERLIACLRSGILENSESNSVVPDPFGSSVPTMVGSTNTFTFADLFEDPQSLCGQRIGPYRIRTLLGSGGSGAVYKATNLNVGMEVCVKISFPLRSDSTAIMAAVSRGIRGIVALKHPHIVQVYDFDRLNLRDGSSFYIVMEFVEGVHLGVWTRQLTDDESIFGARLKMAHDIARAFDAAHNCTYADTAGFQLRGVLHGDIKPMNIHVRDNNEPAIADFMLVDVQRLLHQQQTAAYSLPRLPDDQCTNIFGTPGYMAPEQESTGVVTVQSDIYALGMTLCDLFFPSNDREGASDLSFDSVSMVSEESSRAYPGLYMLLREMNDPSPRRRPESMKDVADRLAAVGARTGIALEGSLVASTLGDHVRPHRSVMSWMFWWLRGASRS